MLKKILIIGILIFVLVGCTIQKDITEPIDEEEPYEPITEPTNDEVIECYSQIDISKGNPASLFCNCMGGKIVIENTAQGQKGICQINGVNYEEWEYFNEMNPYDNTYSPAKAGFDNWVNYCGLNTGSIYCKHFPKQALFCKQQGGEWKKFSNTCVDECGKKPRFCGQAITEGCDCGATKCWGYETDSKGVRAQFPSCLDDIYEPYSTQEEACEKTDGIWIIPEQIPFPITNEALCKDNDGKWVDISKIKNYYIDLGITTKEECEKYRSRCYGTEARPISITKIGICSGDLTVVYDCFHTDFIENNCLLSTEKEWEIKQGNIARCECPEGEKFTIQGCQVADDLMSIIAYG